MNITSRLFHTSLSICRKHWDPERNRFKNRSRCGGKGATASYQSWPLGAIWASESCLECLEPRTESPPLSLLSHSHPRLLLRHRAAFNMLVNNFLNMSAEQLLMLKCGCRDPEVSHHFFQEIKSSVNKIKNKTAVYKIIVLPRKTTVPRSDVLLHLWSYEK